MAEGVHAIDGDTIEARLAVFVNLVATERIRLLGVNAPERRKETMVQYLQAKAFTGQWISGGPFTVETCKRDSFGRLLAYVRRGDVSLADELIKHNLALKQ
jgi:endonuclease YncB( thermonuclease family)